MTGITTAEREYKLEDNVDPSVAVAEGALVTIGEDNVVYAFGSATPDNTPPTMTEPILQVPGAQRHAWFTPSWPEDDFPDRYADEIGQEHRPFPLTAGSGRGLGDQLTPSGSR